jgi:hypothetical protein
MVAVMVYVLAESLKGDISIEKPYASGKSSFEGVGGRGGRGCVCVI